MKNRYLLHQGQLVEGGPHQPIGRHLELVAERDEVLEDVGVESAGVGVAGGLGGHQGQPEVLVPGGGGDVDAQGVRQAGQGREDQGGYVGWEGLGCDILILGVILRFLRRMFNKRLTESRIFHIFYSYLLFLKGFLHFFYK